MGTPQQIYSDPQTAFVAEFLRLEQALRARHQRMLCRRWRVRRSTASLRATAGDRSGAAHDLRRQAK
jgi:ABC-type Fe3+/spermidine/putrescine transport system ATPase subunit